MYFIHSALARPLFKVGRGGEESSFTPDGGVIGQSYITHTFGSAAVPSPGKYLAFFLVVIKSVDYNVVSLTTYLLHRYTYLQSSTRQR